MNVPPFVVADDAMREGRPVRAEKLAMTIRAAWVRAGHEIAVRIVKSEAAETAGKLADQGLVVRSNLVGGLPPTST